MRNAYSYRVDAAVPPFPDDRPIVIFDGNCVMCSASARFVLGHDRAGRFRLLAAQAPLGRALYVHYGLDPVNYESMILIDEGVAWFKSESAIRIAAGLGLPWSLAAVFRIVPMGIRDWVYDWVARNRFRLFGRRAVCYLTDAKFGDRFLA